MRDLGSSVRATAGRWRGRVAAVKRSPLRHAPSCQAPGQAVRRSASCRSASHDSHRAAGARRSVPPRSTGLVCSSICRASSCWTIASPAGDGRSPVVTLYTGTLPAAPADGGPPASAVSDLAERHRGRRRRGHGAAPAAAGDRGHRGRGDRAGDRPRATATAGLRRPPIRSSRRASSATPIVSGAGARLREAVVQAAGTRPVRVLAPWPDGHRWCAALTHDVDVVSAWPAFTALRVAELVCKGQGAPGGQRRGRRRGRGGGRPGVGRCPGGARCRATVRRHVDVVHALRHADGLRRFVPET